MYIHTCRILTKMMAYTVTINVHSIATNFNRRRNEDCKATECISVIDFHFCFISIGNKVKF